MKVITLNAQVDASESQLGINMTRQGRHKGPLMRHIWAEWSQQILCHGGLLQNHIMIILRAIKWKILMESHVPLAL